MAEHLGYVVAGYVATAVALGGYVLSLRRRLRRARDRAAAMAARGARTAT
ncbi:MAG TPA: CcmD family protein [Actinomycetota bacterium]|nr:CcmD family protein [Actinomycetota bacterium]